MDKPLRILLVVNLPWDPRLGAARVWIELAKQWKRAGHAVEKFCLTDAFPKPTRSRGLAALRQAFFWHRTRGYVRKNAWRFDVIDCLIGTLPFSKKSLRFKGLLVGRSIGLNLAYERFIRFSRERWPDQSRGKFLGRFFYRFTSWQLRKSAACAIARCDLINVPNAEEKRLLKESSACAAVMVQPYGLNEQERVALASAVQPAEIRLKRKEICFIGMWSLRKGSRDWLGIVRGIWHGEPNSRFIFLGTMTDEQTVRSDLRLLPRDSVRCIASYDPKELPQLIAGSVVGLFPSYSEGFGLAILEQLACGIPTIAYDVPGPRHIFGADRRDFLVPAGDVRAIIARALEVLRMHENDYASLSARCRAIAAQFRWEQIATETIRQYEIALECIRTGARELELIAN